MREFLCYCKAGQASRRDLCKKTSFLFVIAARVYLLQSLVGVSAVRPSDSFNNTNVTSVTVGADSSKLLLRLQSKDGARKQGDWCAEKTDTGGKLCCQTKHVDGSAMTTNSKYGSWIGVEGCDSCWCGQTKDSQYWMLKPVYDDPLGLNMCEYQVASIAGTEFSYASAWEKVIRAVSRGEIIDLEKLQDCVSFSFDTDKEDKKSAAVTSKEFIHRVRQAAANTPEGRNLYWKKEAGKCKYTELPRERKPEPFTPVDEHELWKLVMNPDVSWAQTSTSKEKWHRAADCVWDPLKEITNADILEDRENQLFGIKERIRPELEWNKLGGSCEYDVGENLGKSAGSKVTFEELWNIVENNGEASYEELFDCIAQNRGNGEVEVVETPYVDASELGQDVRRKILNGRLKDAKWKNNDAIELLQNFSFGDQDYSLKGQPVTMDELQAALVRALETNNFDQEIAFDKVTEAFDKGCTKDEFKAALKQVYKWHFQNDKLLWVWRGDERNSAVLGKKFMGGASWRKAPEWDEMVFRGLFEDIGAPKHGQLVTAKQIERLLIYLQKYFVTKKMKETDASKKARENLLESIKGPGVQRLYIDKYLHGRAKELEAELAKLCDETKWWSDKEWPDTVPEKTRRLMRQGAVINKADVTALLHFMPLEEIKKHVADQLTFLAKSLLARKVVWTGLPLKIYDDDLLPGEIEYDKGVAKSAFQEAFTEVLRTYFFRHKLAGIAKKMVTEKSREALLPLYDQLSAAWLDHVERKFVPAEDDWKKLRGQEVTVVDMIGLLDGYGARDGMATTPLMVRYHLDNWLRSHTQSNHEDSIQYPFIADQENVYKAAWQEDVNMMEAFENEYRWATSFERSDDFQGRQDLLKIYKPRVAGLVEDKPVRRAIVQKEELVALCYSPTQAANLGLIVPQNTYPLLPDTFSSDGKQEDGPYVWTTQKGPYIYIDPDTHEEHELKSMYQIDMLNMYIREFFSRPEERRNYEDPMPPIPGGEVFLDQAVTIVHSDQNVLYKMAGRKILIPHDLYLAGYIKTVPPTVRDAVSAAVSRTSRNGLMTRRGMLNKGGKDKHTQYNEELQAQYKAIDDFQRRPKKGEYFMDLDNHKRFGVVLEDNSVEIDGYFEVAIENPDEPAVKETFLITTGIKAESKRKHEKVNIADSAVKKWIPARFFTGLSKPFMALSVKTNDQADVGQMFRKGRIKNMIVEDNATVLKDAPDKWFAEAGKDVTGGVAKRKFGVYLVANKEQTGAYKSKTTPDNKPEDYLLLTADQFDVMLRPSLESRQLHADQQLKDLDRHVGAGGLNQPFDEAIHLQYLRMFREMHPDHYVPDNEVSRQDVYSESSVLLESIFNPEEMGIGILAQRQEVMLTGPEGYDGYLAQISSVDVDVPACSEWPRPRPFKLPDEKTANKYPGNEHAIDTMPYFITGQPEPGLLWYHVTIVASNEGELQDPRCGGWVSIWEIMPVADTHADRRGETLEGLDRIGQAVKIKENADLSNACRITQTTPNTLGKSEWNLIQGRVGTIQLAEKADPIEKYRLVKDAEIEEYQKKSDEEKHDIINSGELKYHEIHDEKGSRWILMKRDKIERSEPQFYWHYTVLLTPKRADPEDFHYRYRWTEKGAKAFPKELPYEAGLCLPEPPSGPLTPEITKEGDFWPVLSKDCADGLVQGILGSGNFKDQTLPFGIDSLVQRLPPVEEEEGPKFEEDLGEGLNWLTKEKVTYMWKPKAVEFYTQHFPEAEVPVADTPVTSTQTQELLKKFNLDDMHAVNDHYKLDFQENPAEQVNPETKNEMIGRLISSDMEPEMLSSLRHKMERFREHTEMMKNEVNEMERQKLKREHSGSTLSASDLKKYEQIVWDHRKDTWPMQDQMNAAVRHDEETHGMETAGKRLEQMRQMYSALIPDVAKARILSGADLPANGIKHNIKELGHHGLNFLGSAIGSSKLGDHLIKFLRSAHKSTRTNGTKYRQNEDKTDSLYEEDQVSKYADELRRIGENDWGDFGPWRERPGPENDIKRTVITESWPNLVPWKE